MTTWQPSTCDCLIEWTDDNNFTFIKSHAVCSIHKGLENTPDHLEQVKARHKTHKSTVESKNEMLSESRKKGPASALTNIGKRLLTENGIPHIDARPS